MHCSSRGKGEAILFIHGIPTNGTLWNGVIRQLSSRYRCLTIDLPGMGRTPAARYGAGCLDRLAGQIEALRVQHKIWRWHVVGHDAGSAVAAHYAGHFSKRVSSLSLLSPAMFPDLKPYYLLNTLRKPVVGEILAPLVQALFWDVAMRRALVGDTRGQLLHTFRQPFTGHAGPWEFMRLIRWGTPEVVLGSMPATLAGLCVPTLVFHASNDILPIDFAERAVALIAGSRMITLASGHFSPLEKPSEIAAHLHDFFQGKRRICAEREARMRPGKRRRIRDPLAEKYGRVSQPAA